MKKEPVVLILLAEHAPAIDAIRRAHPNADVRIGPWITEDDETIAREMAEGVEILFCETPPANFDDFNQLKWMHLTSAGYSHITHLPLVERGIVVTNGLGTFDIPIAEWNTMMMLCWHRNMLDAQADQRECNFNCAPEYQRELRGSVVGLYGYGGIARETARLAKAMGLTVWTYTRGPVKKRADTYCVAGTGDPDGVLPDRVFAGEGFEEFLSGVDYLIITTPHTGTTEGSIGEKELRLVKPSAVLINPARAPIVDEAAYIKCLSEKWIRGSSLDVHYAYPLPSDHPLWSLPNLIMTAHISGAAESPQFLERAYDIFAQNLERFCSGQTLLNELTPSQLQGK